MSKNNDDKIQKSKMLEIRDILKNQVQIYSNLHTTLNDTSKSFDKIDDAYTTYGSEIIVSSSHISKLKKREFFENLFIYIGFVFFFLCVAYILLKRFPIHHMIYLCYNMLEYIFGTLNLLFTNINYQLTEIIYFFKTNITDSPHLTQNTFYNKTNDTNIDL